MSGPGPFYSRPGSNPDRFETIQPRRETSGNPRSYSPTKACPCPRKAAHLQQRAAYRSRSVPGRIPLPPPRACKYVRAFPPCAPLLHPVVTLPILPALAPSGHSKCLPHRPARHSIACPAPVSVFVSASLCAALLILPACQWSKRA